MRKDIEFKTEDGVTLHVGTTCPMPVGEVGNHCDGSRFLCPERNVPRPFRGGVRSSGAVVGYVRQPKFSAQVRASRARSSTFGDRYATIATLSHMRRRSQRPTLIVLGSGGPAAAAATFSWSEQ
jgi:hypothetical protein